MKRLLFFLLVVGCTKSAPTIAAPIAVDPVALPAKPARPAREEILETILASEKALLEEGDVDTHLAAWTADAHIVRARTREPSRYDTTVPVDRLRPTLRMIVAREARRKVEVEKVDITVNGDDATLSWRAASSEKDKATDYFREAFVLRRTSAGWRVVEKRYWPSAREEEDGERHKFNASTFDEMDRHVERMRVSGDQLQLAYALFSAYRFTEALDLARRLTKEENAGKWVWEMRALSALMVGEAEEAATSYARAAEASSP